MPTDFLQLTTAFSGVQLIVIAYLVFELRGVSKDQAKMTLALAKQGDEIDRLNRQVAGVMGRLKILVEGE